LAIFSLSIVLLRFGFSSIIYTEEDTIFPLFCKEKTSPTNITRTKAVEELIGASRTIVTAMDDV
jgi:hypothetical protein